MNLNELKNEINFGLGNLESIYQSILEFSRQEIEERVKVSALTYECLRYYNAIEHLIIRLLKYLKIEIPSGPFSHRDTLKALLSITKEKDVDNDTIKVIENLMAFRHIATKIYGFLINWSKLKFIIRDIETSHNQIKRFFTNVLDAIQAGDK
ncbi:hypothetical protein AUJ95_04910 [Candidatus Desantisbacteria bacterium CG2_30_40_21]|uniref:HepT-like domain-containing protein n=3 Tax=unclassified Candidatus Desantisiibacteriota TaxID=3106372 RepID=A0A2M7JCT9_9BACT|nr:MAG: hypothetical protein AUJ95_04910 [Candidatus Desantisbacteria bacterium CG2_30_40_21]PIP40872.1 MAG: hypothetical protein COX18_05270 [Candidatus Desantisbacteria bacterium CG23_combo_of_CG06-09_8_20_14_all_40_23]PIX17225.1 MAG: hypothetical protein COZ71_04425 [Candidatus Desantisbacteria bacterium CG_4_8_14_3_um_filter_40_12]